MESNDESGLVFIVTQGIREPVIDALFERLRKANLRYEAFHSHTERPADSYREAIEQSIGHILPRIRTLVAGRGISVSELISALPNVQLVISTDPSLNNTPSNNGGPSVRFVDTQPEHLVSYDLIAQKIQDYLANGNSTSAAPEH